ncbi:ATP-dependent DNA helicase RecG [Helicobacter brantae]|uniref:ATP-dependent DNA helicase RecG n=1 Tax=Helicobacter brantae TaxID=375927 RepID=A0A3D8J172_9HELI|nr:ATP-dependent DNA helicase RecG [Helicobacter brantae]RDU71123.1 ATP-dependent DNA helicase RecG [Helicobacter brantae]
MEKDLVKLKCKNLLEVALITPKGYENSLLLQNLDNLPSTGVVQAKILSHHRTPKTLQIGAFLPSFNTPLKITIFYPKKYHTSLFPIDSTLYLQGKIQKQFELEMIQPKVIKHFGEITPIFEKRKGVNLLELTRSLITEQNLLQTPLPREYIPHILPIFHPTLPFYRQYTYYKTFPPSSLKSLKFIEVFLYLQSLQKKKRNFEAKCICQGEVEGFISSLPFPLTQGQRNAIEQIRKDLSSSIASRRLIMGDVGSGKTIVILCSVLLAYPHKSILMAPTTILATQLYEEAQKFLPSFVRVGLFLGDRESKKQSYQDFDFIIGTQALIHRDDSLDDFALVMSDEQHRFGTQQRFFLEKLASKEGKKPHILQFSATPIPRTMAMLQSDLISHTFIKDTPFVKDITTQILYKQDFPSLLAHIKKELEQDHQVIIVYPLVEESESFAYTSLKEGEGYWRKHFEGVYCTNGGDKDKDKVLQEFREKGKILLATTLIEVGISLPRLSTIVIVGAERMGLATLHQLRGRVSRNGLKGYCFLFTYSHNNQRLKDFTQTKNGFEIAELDLKYRKGGDLLEGERQSGDEFRFFDPSSDLEILENAKEVLTQTKNAQKQDIM